MRVAVVTNARSGSGNDPDEVVQRLARRGAQLVPIDIRDLDSLPADVDRVVVVGGDGSIGPAALAAHRAQVPLAVVPVGTANDFARATGLPADLEAACDLASDPGAAIQHREVGLINGHPFVNTAAAGLSTAAADRAAPLKPRLGRLAYPVGAVRAALTASPLTCRVRCQDAEVFAGSAWQVVVAVTGAFGGGSSIGGTRRDDELLDVAIVPAGRRLRLVQRAYGMRRGRLTEQEDVPHHRGLVVDVQIPADTGFNVDGETRPGGPARFSVLQGGVDLIAPRFAKA